MKETSWLTQKLFANDFAYNLTARSTEEKHTSNFANAFASAQTYFQP